MSNDNLAVIDASAKTYEIVARPSTHGFSLTPRFFYPMFACNEGLSSVKEFIQRTGITEVLLFTASLQADANYFPDEQINERCHRIRYVINELAAMGVASSINVEGTIGHHSGSRDIERFPFRGMVDLSGKISDACACPLDESWQSYVQRLYRGLAATGAEKIFIDDDLRYGWHPADGGVDNTYWDTCFCEEHLRLFGEVVRQSFSREELGAALANGDGDLKQAWFEFKANSLLHVADLLRESVHSVNPDCRLGLMNTFMANARRDRDLYTLLLHLAGHNRPLLRPAQGYYSDRDRLGLLHGIGETLLAMESAPPNTEIVVEIDGGTPYNCFNKSSRVLFDLQAKADIGCGLTNLSLNVFDDCDFTNFTRSEHRSYLENGCMRSLEHVVKNLPQDASLVGVGIIAGKGPFEPDPPNPDYNLQRDAMVTLWRLGVPLTIEKSSISVLTHGSIQGTDLDALFDRSGVIVDLCAANEICELGRGDLLGIKSVDEIGAYSRDVLSDHPLNAGLGGSILGIAHCVPRSLVSKLVVDETKTNSLGRIIGFHDEDLGPSAVVFERGKRRVITLAYSLAAAAAFVTFKRKDQMFRMLRWLSEDNIPILVEGTADVVPFMLHNGDECMLSLLNLSMDAATDFSVSLANHLKFSVCRGLDGSVRRVSEGIDSNRASVEGLIMGPMSIAQFIISK